MGVVFSWQACFWLCCSYLSASSWLQSLAWAALEIRSVAGLQLCGAAVPRRSVAAVNVETPSNGLAAAWNSGAWHVQLSAPDVQCRVVPKSWAHHRVSGSEFQSTFHSETPSAGTCTVDFEHVSLCMTCTRSFQYRQSSQPVHTLLLAECLSNWSSN